MKLIKIRLLNYAYNGKKWKLTNDKNNVITINFILKYIMADVTIKKTNTRRTE